MHNQSSNLRRTFDSVDWKPRLISCATCKRNSADGAAALVLAGAGGVDSSASALSALTGGDASVRVSMLEPMSRCLWLMEVAVVVRNVRARSARRSGLWWSMLLLVCLRRRVRVLLLLRWRCAWFRLLHCPVSVRARVKRLGSGADRARCLFCRGGPVCSSLPGTGARSRAPRAAVVVGGASLSVDRQEQLVGTPPRQQQRGGREREAGWEGRGCCCCSCALAWSSDGVATVTHTFAPRDTLLRLLMMWLLVLARLELCCCFTTTIDAIPRPRRIHTTVLSPMLERLGVSKTEQVCVQYQSPESNSNIRCIRSRRQNPSTSHTNAIETLLRHAIRIKRVCIIKTKSILHHTQDSHTTYKYQVLSELLLQPQLEEDNMYSQLE